MDSKTLNQRIADSLGIDNKTVGNLLGSLAKVLAESADSLTTVAIPSFGSFIPVKYDEEVRADLSSGKKILFPPQISIEFQPAVSLRKKVLESHE